MAAPALLQIRPVSVNPPCITASTWPSHVSVTLAVSTGESTGTASTAAMSEGYEDFDLFRPWLLSAFQHGSEQALPRHVPSCVHSSPDEVLVTFRDLEISASVPGVISLALCPAEPAHGAGQQATIEAIPLMVSPTVGGCAEAVAMFDCMKQLVQQQDNTQQQQQQQQQHGVPHHHQQLQESRQLVDCCAVVGSSITPAPRTSQSLAGMHAPDAVSINMPCTQAQAAAATAAACVPGACCAHCNFGRPEAAAEQALLRCTWQQHFLPLLLDMHAALTCTPKPFLCRHRNAASAAAEHLAAAAHNNSSTGSFAAAARIPNALEGWAQHSTAAALPPFSPGAATSRHTAAAGGVHAAQPAILLELAGCAPPPVEVAGQMLIGVVEFLALHSCWCNVSFLLAEAFKNGLLAATGALAAQQLQRLQRLQRMQAPVCSAMLTAASLMAALAGAAAAADEQEAAEVEAAAHADAAGASAEPAAHPRPAGSLHSNPTNPSDPTGSATTASPSASAPTSMPTNSPAPVTAGCTAARACSSSSAPSARQAVVLAALLLVFMPAAALLLAAAGSHEMGVQRMEVSLAAPPFDGVSSCVAELLPAGLAVAAPALQMWLCTALMSLVLLVMVAVSCGRNALRKQV